jgi:hypothetical protein
MINRYYFMKIKRHNPDGYSFQYALFHLKSWLPDPNKAHCECYDTLKSKIGGDPEGIIEVMTFNRV